MTHAEMLADAQLQLAKERLEDGTEYSAVPVDAELLAHLRALVAADPDLRNRRARLLAAQRAARADVAAMEVARAAARRGFWIAVADRRQPSAPNVSPMRRRA